MLDWITVFIELLSYYASVSSLLYTFLLLKFKEQYSSSHFIKQMYFHCGQFSYSINTGYTSHSFCQLHDTQFPIIPVIDSLVVYAYFNCHRIKFYHLKLLLLISIFLHTLPHGLFMCFVMIVSISSHSRFTILLPEYIAVVRFTGLQ